MCLSLLQIITPNANDIYDLDPETIFNMMISKTNFEQRKLIEVYPNFIYYLRQILVYYSTDSVDGLISNIQKELIHKDKRRFD